MGERGEHRAAKSGNRPKPLAENLLYLPYLLSLLSFL